MAYSPEGLQIRGQRGAEGARWRDAGRRWATHVGGPGGQGRAELSAHTIDGRRLQYATPKRIYLCRMTMRSTVSASSGAPARSGRGHTLTADDDDGLLSSSGPNRCCALAPRRETLPILCPLLARYWSGARMASSVPCHAWRDVLEGCADGLFCALSCLFFA